MTNEIIKVTMNESNEQVVSARDLYNGLEIKQRFSAWFDNNSKNLIEGIDFTPVSEGTPVKGGNGNVQYVKDYQLTLDASKQIALMSASEKGKEIRMYFIKVEKAWNSPEQVMARGLQVAQQQMLQYDQQIKSLNETIELQAPKVELAEKLLESEEANISMKDFSKVLANYGLNMGRNTLMKELRASGWLLQDNTPSAKAMERSIFQVYEKVVKTTTGTRIQTVTTITPKGQEFLIKRVTRDRSVA